MPQFTDQAGRQVFIKDKPARIISLVPSQTELLHYLGLEAEVAGITKFCVHPENWFRTKTRIGGTKKINLDLIRSIEPDLVIGNKEENIKDQVESLAEEFPVWLSDVNNFEEALWMIAETGKITGKEQKANELCMVIRQAFDDLKPATGRRKCLYLIWENPVMAAGSGTFINAMLKVAGFENAIGHLERYPELSPEQIKESDPELIFLSTEPYPFTEDHIGRYQSILPAARVIIVDGEMFSWYGSRMLKAAGYFRELRMRIN